MLVAAALVFSVAVHHRAYAQAKTEERNSAAKKRTDIPNTGAAAGHSGKKAQRGRKPRTGLAIPEPTVVLPPGKAPVIEFVSPVFDFGRVRAGTAVQHDFVFTNTGNGILEILKAKAG